MADSEEKVLCCNKCGKEVEPMKIEEDNVIAPVGACTDCKRVWCRFTLKEYQMRE